MGNDERSQDWRKKWKCVERILRKLFGVKVFWLIYYFQFVLYIWRVSKRTNDLKFRYNLHIFALQVSDFINQWILERFMPSSIYSWSIGHILENEFFCLGRLGSSGSKEKKVDLSYSEQLLRVVFSTSILLSHLLCSFQNSAHALQLFMNKHTTFLFLVCTNYKWKETIFNFVWWSWNFRWSK